MDEDDDYNDDFSDQDFAQETHHDDEVPPDDEQHAQKVNGKLEVLQSEIDDLTVLLNTADTKINELLKDKDKQEEVNKILRDELEVFKSAPPIKDNVDSAELTDLRAENAQLKEKLNIADSTEEVVDLRAKNILLEEKLSEALSFSSDTCPLLLKQEFLKCCKGIKKFSDLKERDFNAETCVKVLQKLSKSFASNNESSQGSLTNIGNDASKRIMQLEQELKLCQSTTTEDVKALRSKVTRMNERIRIEKEMKYKAEVEVQACIKKIDMLGSHMEKLVVHLKHEGAHKLRVVEQFHTAEREIVVLTEKCDLISRKSSAKDRLILELREGSKVLEDQLRLMDEKYLELRTKLDYARELGNKKIKKAEKIASELRVKFAMTNGSALLDAIPMPGDGYGCSTNASINGGLRSGSVGNNSSNINRMRVGSAGNYNNGNYMGDNNNNGMSLSWDPQLNNGNNNNAPSPMMMFNNQMRQASFTIEQQRINNNNNNISTPSTYINNGNNNNNHSRGGGVRGGGVGIKSILHRQSSGMSQPGSASVGSLMSISTSGSLKEPNMEAVMDKIRVQEGRRKDWTEEKARALAERKQTSI